VAGGSRQATALLTSVLGTLEPKVSMFWTRDFVFVYALLGEKGSMSGNTAIAARNGSCRILRSRGRRRPCWSLSVANGGNSWRRADCGPQESRG
jgi:hypothetical protein